MVRLTTILKAMRSTVTEINGSAAGIGNQVTLASGALVTLIRTVPTAMMRTGRSNGPLGSSIPMPSPIPLMTITVAVSLVQ